MRARLLAAVFLLSACTLTIAAARAESTALPISKVAFYRDYGDVPLVAKALKKAALDREVFAFLESAAPIDEKAAVINALGRQAKGVPSWSRKDGNSAPN